MPCYSGRCVDCDLAIGDLTIDGRKVTRAILECMGCEKTWCQDCGVPKVVPNPMYSETKFSYLDPVANSRWDVVCSECQARPPTEDKRCRNCGSFVYVTLETCSHHHDSCKIQICLKGCNAKVPIARPKMPEKSTSWKQWVRGFVPTFLTEERTTETNAP